MSSEPARWSVVLIGKWNKAILSPKGIAKYVFGLPEGTKMQVQVPVDGVSPYLVSNPEETLSVHVDDERLQIDLLKCTYDVLGRAMKSGVDVLETLPITPITAVGFKVNFKIPELPDELIRITECEIDKKVAIAGYEIVNRSIGLSLRWREGVVNLSVNRRGEEYQIGCNFHFSATQVAKAQEWLKTPIESIKEQIHNIWTILGLEPSGGTDA